MRQDPYNRIMTAAKDGRGVNLNADEVRALASDCAISDRALFISKSPTDWTAQVSNARQKPRYFGTGC